MARVFLVITLLMLAACESDFQKCMNTEVPRAKQLLGVDEQAARVASLSAMAEKLEIVVPIFREAIDWDMANPAPVEPKKREISIEEMPEFLESLSHLDERQQFAEVQKRNLEYAEQFELEKAQYEAELEIYDSKSNDFYFKNGKAAGFSGNTWEEMYVEDDQYYALYEEINDLVRDRALELGCWDSRRCVDPLYEELRGQGGVKLAGEGDPMLEVAPAAVAGSLSMAIKALSDLQSQSSELATVTCNTNGLYE